MRKNEILSLSIYTDPSYSEGRRTLSAEKQNEKNKENSQNPKFSLNKILLILFLHIFALLSPLHIVKEEEKRFFFLF